MKISYRNKTGIKVIETGFFMAESNNEKDQKIIDLLRQTFAEQKHVFKPIKIISQSMAESIHLSAEKMIKDEIWNNVGEVFGSIILGRFTYCFAINSNGSPIHDHSIFIFQGGKLVAYEWQNLAKDYRLTIVPQTEKHLLQYVEYDGKANWQDAVFGGLYTILIAAINFLKYAEIEDKFIKANSREKGIDCKYINETNSDIHYITSHYINNLYVQGAFKVRGHWRLQPKKKEGEWTKELIWINDFEKTGYTAPARKLKDNPETD
jgi:hypothetical protein